ncbi:MAG: hypothetical protein RIR62_3131 [Pseudomonadota bacterium]
MSGLKTYVCAPLCLALLAPALPDFAPPALAQTTPDAEYFATCTGRLSALMEHQFLTDGPASDATRDRRDAMAEILDALAPPDQTARLMALRVDAKAAHRALLEQARFGPDPDRRAAGQADRLIAACTGLLLG